MATNNDVRAALLASIPGYTPTDADVNYWANQGGVNAVKNTFGGGNDFAVGGQGVATPAPTPSPSFVVGGQGATTTASPAPSGNGFSVGGGAPTSASGSVYTPTTANQRQVAGGYQVSNLSSTDPNWGKVGLADPNNTNPLGGNLNMGTLMMHGFKTPEEYLKWQAGNVQKAAADTSGFAIGGQGVMPKTGTLGQTATGTTGTTGSSNTAIVDALRQKPTRYAGLGMGTSTNAVSPQAKSIDLDKTKTPSGLFQSV